MFFTVNNAPLYAYTGGKAFDATKPTAILIHGVLCDHSVWALQSRYLANHGWNVLAIDLPGHCKSGGTPPLSVEAAADSIAQLMDAAGLQHAALVGHSWGSLIAMETAARLQQRISHLVLVGTAFPMKVSPALLASALNTPEQAIQMVNTFSRATLAPPNGAGSWVFGAAMAAITCPVLFVLGEQDQMTPPKAAKGLIQAAQAAGKAVTVQTIPHGHNQMTESPDATLFAIHGFLR